MRSVYAGKIICFLCALIIDLQIKNIYKMFFFCYKQHLFSCFIHFMCYNLHIGGIFMANKDRTRINIFLPKSALEYLDEQARKQGTNRTSYLTNLILQHNNQLEMLETMRQAVLLATLSQDKK